MVHERGSSKVIVRGASHTLVTLHGTCNTNLAEIQHTGIDNVFQRCMLVGKCGSHIPGQTRELG